ncbi:MAG: hypothetical protein H0W78_13135 [Planctomycetes bacterium]|nr:hypothetical protein [Planctomycetota bacterium]MBA3964548.1 hypothetical protein [Nitrospirales bacterium]
MNREEFLDMYHAAAVKPEAWLARGMGSFLATKPLRDQYDAACRRAEKLGDFNLGQTLGPTYLMLFGYAFECFLKAAIVHKNCHRYLVNGRIDEKQYAEIYTHDLLSLWNLSGLALSTDLQKVLQAISEYTIWAGRYPFAKNADKAVAAFSSHKLDDGWPWDWDHMTDKHEMLTDMLCEIASLQPGGEYFAKLLNPLKVIGRPSKA